MSSHRETDTFPDELLTSADYPNWLAKKTRRGSKAAKAVGKSSRGPMQSRNWAEDKFPRTQQPQVPIVAKVKPEKQGVSIAGIRKPVVYQNWVLICDREYLLWGKLQKGHVVYASSLTYECFQIICCESLLPAIWTIGMHFSKVCGTPWPWGVNRRQPKQISAT